MYQVLSRPDLGPTTWSLEALREGLARGDFGPEDEVRDSATGVVAPLWHVAGFGRAEEARKTVVAGPPVVSSQWSEAPRLTTVWAPGRPRSPSVHWGFSVGLWLAAAVQVGNLVLAGALFPGPLLAHGAIGFIMATILRRDRSAGALSLLVVSAVTMAVGAFLML